MTSQLAVSSPHDLGELHAEYRHPAMLSMGFFILTGALFWWGAWFVATQSPPEPLLALLFGGGGVFFLGMVIWGTSRIPRRVRVYDAGLLIEQIGRTELFRWEEIEVAQAQLMSTNGLPMLQLFLRTSDNRKLGFGNTLDEPKQRRDTQVPQIGINALAATVIESSAPERFALMRARYESGQRIEFKRFQISQAGIHVRKQTLSWSLVADIQADHRFMIVMAVGQPQAWQVLRLSEVPNSDLLGALVAHARGTGFSAFQEGQDTRALKQAAMTYRWRWRLFSWGFVLLGIGLYAGQIYSVTYMSAPSHRQRGEAAFDRGDYQGALSEFEAVLRMHPTDDDAYINRGRAYAELGRYTEALADYDIARQLNPQGSRAIAQRGRVYHYQRRWDAALEAYNRSIARSPRSAFAYCGRGETYQQLGRVTEARANYVACRDLTSDAQRKAQAERLLRELDS